MTVKASIAAEPPELEGATRTTIERLTVYCFLQARLRGPKVTIGPSDFQRRSFLDQSTVSWTWDVEPKETGDLRLTLEVQSLVRDEAGAVAELNSDILVEAAARSALRMVNDTAVAIVTHPVVQFFGAGAFLAGGAYGWRRFKRK